jgi:hypothetical protein
MLSEYFVQKDEGHMFSLLYGIYIKEINIYTKQTWSYTNMQKVFVIVELCYGTWGLRERERDWQGINNIVIHNICEGRGYNNMYWKLLKNGGSKGE